MINAHSFPFHQLHHHLPPSIARHKLGLEIKSALEFLRMSIFGLLVIAFSSDKSLERKAFRKTQRKMRMQEEQHHRTQVLYYRVGGFR